MDGLIISNINDDGHIEISSTNINIQSNLMNIPTENANVNDLLSTLATDGSATLEQITDVNKNNLLTNIQNNCLVDKNEESTVINKCYQVEPSVIENDDVIKQKQNKHVLITV